ncbi:MAG: hypothetical protein ACKVP0_15555 [Pirellulaceae bacterium]
MELLSNEIVKTGLRKAWQDSNPGPTGGHEEGGFVVRGDDGARIVVRWPRGSGNSIIVADPPGGRIKEGQIVATFHTHPNTSSDYVQEPSETDRRAVRDDPDLKGPDYLGEIVISAEWLYLIKPSGTVEVVGRTADIQQ